MLRVLNYWDAEEQGFGQGLGQKSLSWVDFPSLKPHSLPGEREPGETGLCSLSALLTMAFILSGGRSPVLGTPWLPRLWRM